MYPLKDMKPPTFNQWRKSRVGPQGETLNAMARAFDRKVERELSELALPRFEKDPKKLEKVATSAEKVNNSYTDYTEAYVTTVSKFVRYGSDVINSLQDELGRIEKELAKPSMRVVLDNEQLIKRRQWVKAKDIRRWEKKSQKARQEGTTTSALDIQAKRPPESIPYITDQAIAKVNRLKIEQIVLRDALDTIAKAKDLPFEKFPQLDLHTVTPNFKKATPFRYAPQNELDQDILRLISRSFTESEGFRRRDILQGSVTKETLDTKTSSSETISDRLVKHIDELNKGREERLAEFNELGPNTYNTSVEVIGPGPQPIKGPEAYVSKLLKVWKDLGFISTIEGKKGYWQLTDKGRTLADEVLVDPIKISENVSTSGLKRDKYTNIDAEGLSIGQRDLIASFEKKIQDLYENKYKVSPEGATRETLRELPLSAEDARLISEWNQKIREIRNAATPPKITEGIRLFGELDRVRTELYEIEHLDILKKRLPTKNKRKPGPFSLNQTSKDLRNLYIKASQRKRDLLNQEMDLSNQLRELLGTAVDLPRPSTNVIRDHGIFRPSRKLNSMVESELRAVTDAPKKPVDPVAKKPVTYADKFADNEINWKGYTGATDNLSISDKLKEAYKGNNSYYTDEWKKIHGNKTAVQEVMQAWAHRMNKEAVGRSGGFDAHGTGGYRNPTGEPFSGEHNRVFSTEELADNFEFMEMFETDLSRIVSNYSATKGAEIRSQEVLNSFLKKAGITSNLGEELTNIRWSDVFDRMKNTVKNLAKERTEDGEVVFAQSQIKALTQTVELVEEVYYDMIGKPRYQADGKLDRIAKSANNVAQALFGSGISQTVALIELPMAILARSGDMGGLARGLKILFKDIGKLNSLSKSELEGTAFVMENYNRGGLHRYVNTNKLEMETRWSRRMKKIINDGLHASENALSESATSKAMDRIDNFLEMLAKVQTEVTGLRHVINATKNIAVGKAKYTVLKSIPAITKFNEKFEHGVFEVMKSPKEQVKYIKGLARETGLDYSFAMRWVRAGLVRDADGLDVMPIVINLLEMADPQAGTWNWVTMFERMTDRKYSLGNVERLVYEDVFDRFAGFVEMQARDLSPEPRGLGGYTHFNRNAFGRLFSFYATYPLAFYNTYMRKNPTEGSSTRALTFLVAITALETFHKQVRDLQTGRASLDELKENWSDHPWAMVMSNATNTPWLGYASRAARSLFVEPATNRALGKPQYPYRAMNIPAVGVLSNLGQGIQDLTGKGYFFSRPQATTSGPPRMIDYLVGATDDNKQASRLMDFMYDLILPTKFFGMTSIDNAFFGSTKPSQRDREEILFQSHQDIMAEMMENGYADRARDLWSQVVIENEISQEPSTWNSDAVRSSIRDYQPRVLRGIQSRSEAPRTRVPNRPRPTARAVPRESITPAETLLNTPKSLEAPSSLKE